MAKANRKLRLPQRVPSDTLIETAERVDPWRGTEERVILSARDKPGFGQFRTVVAFGLEHRALQALARDAVRPFHQFDPRQYAARNGGRDAACLRVRDVLAAGKHKWFVGLDIAEFYPSIDRGRLAKIVPLPARVIEASTRISNDIGIGRIGKAITSVNLIQDARRGVSQGSSLSPVIAEFIVAALLHEVGPALLIINFADDFGVMARTKREAEAVSQALINAARRSPFGLFQLKRKTPLRQVSKGFDFLGYRFKGDDGHVTCRPSEVNEIKFFTKSLKHMHAILRRRPNAKEGLQRYVKSWAEAFQLWDTGGDLFWPRFWVRGVARQHLPRAYIDVEYAMQWEGDGFRSMVMPPSGFMAGTL